MDPLASLKFNESSDGSLFVEIKEGSPVKLRVISVDPYISRDRFGNTKFGFIVWDFNENRPKVLNKGSSIAKAIQQLHMDEDYGSDITKVDIKISATGEKKDTRYAINVLPKVTDITEEQFNKCYELKLDAIIKNGVFASEYNEGKKIPEVTGAEPDEGIDLSDVFPE